MICVSAVLESNEGPRQVKVNANDFCFFPFLCTLTGHLLLVGSVSAELLAAAETNAHREAGKTKGRQCRPFRRLCGGPEEEEEEGWALVSSLI